MREVSYSHRAREVLVMNTASLEARRAEWGPGGGCRAMEELEGRIYFLQVEMLDTDSHCQLQQHLDSISKVQPRTKTLTSYQIPLLGLAE